MPWAFALVVAASDDSVTSCSADAASSSTSSPSPLRFAHGDAALTIAVGTPPPSDLAVPIRGRSRLVYSWRSEFPEHIGAPATDAFPLVVTADSSSPAANITDHAAAAAALMSERLIAHGAVFFRGLPLSNSADFSSFVDGLGWQAAKLGGGGTPRKDLFFNVRTASEEPDEHTIEPHMDMAHSVAHPKRIAFFCAAGPPPNVGGETVLTDMRQVHSILEAQGIPQLFAERGGVAYVKRLWSAEHVNHSYTWQQFFFTPELEEAVAEVRRRDPHAIVDAERGVIDFREVLPVLFAHPTSGEPLWFNGVHTNHRSYYEEALHVDTSDGPPMDTTYADGTPIPDDVIAAIRAAVWKSSVALRLQTGDLVVVDNMLASHGRMGWVPGNPRKVLLTHFS